MSLIQKFKDLFTTPDTSDQERLDRWHKEVDEADRLKELHRKSRKQEKKGLIKKKEPKKPISYTL